MGSRFARRPARRFGVVCIVVFCAVVGYFMHRIQQSIQQSIQQTVTVTFRYDVVFTTGLFAPGNTLLRDTLAGDSFGPEGPKKVLCVVDDGVAAAHPSLLADLEAYARRHAGVVRLVCPPMVFPGGEKAKNDPPLVEAVHAAVDRYGIDRHSYVMAVGGGALLDLAGYAAATAHRGVRLVRVPTTVLAQNDSAVGVKNGVNHFGKKNFLGTFAPPFAVLNDFDFLPTLEDRDWLGGVSEAVKVALLKDPAFFDYLAANAGRLVRRDLEAMRHVVVRCAELHLAHIATSGDAFELGSSRPLDFGHWAAHKLEQLTGYDVRHGEAVAVGIALDATYSHLAGRLARADWQRIVDTFGALHLAVYHPRLSDAQRLLEGLREFREHLGGRLTIMLLDGIGRGCEVHEMDETMIVKSVNILEEIASSTTSSVH